MRWVLYCLVLAACGRVDFDAVTDRCALHAFVDEPYANSFEGADGVTTPLLVCSDTQLVRIAARPEDWGKAFVLGADIDLAGATVTPIGTMAQPFTGTFDGDGHTIGHLTIDLPNQDRVGLFGYAIDASFTGVSLRGVNVVGGNTVGALVGYLEAMPPAAISIDHVHVDGIINGGNDTAGVVGEANCFANTCAPVVLHDIDADIDVTGARGAAGIVADVYNEPPSQALLTNLHATGHVTGDLFVGGIVGDLESGIVDLSSASVTVDGRTSTGGLVGTSVFTGTSFIRRSFATGDVTCTEDQCGGLTGDIEGSVEQSYATGNVRCMSTCSGLTSDTSAHVWESYSTGDVTCTGPQCAGIVADMYGTEIRDCYATGTISGTTFVGGVVAQGAGAPGFIITRTYSSARVSGSDAVGGVAGEAGSTVSPNTFSDSFGVGPVSGNSATNSVSMVVGRVASAMVTVSGTAFASDVSCTNTAGACSVGGSAMPAAAFVSASTAPMTSWDFVTVWQENPGALPTLRNVPH